MASTGVFAVAGLDPVSKERSADASQGSEAYGVRVVAEPAYAPAPGKVGRLAPVTALPLSEARFHARFGSEADTIEIASVAADNRPIVDFLASESEASGIDGSPELAGSRQDERVRSPIEVFSYNPHEEISSPLDDKGRYEARAADVIQEWREPRADLLEGVPEEYARLVLIIAAEEGVDPNLMLSIMRAENGHFDPHAVSPAGAVGLMQLMPDTGHAYGARDLRDPSENIRAGARFLRDLVQKYRNPVLVASAYNAGEPRVDVRNSLPLIEETADYVTRVVGLYTNTIGSDGIASIGRETGSRSAPVSRSGEGGRGDPAKSPMLVFSVEGATDMGGGLEQQSEQASIGGPVKVRKEQ